jgi:hypothetical protein
MDRMTEFDLTSRSAGMARRPVERARRRASVDRVERLEVRHRAVERRLTTEL